MNLFRKLHGRRTPHGLEIRILRRLPRIALVGSLLPAALAVLVRIMPSEPGEVYIVEIVLLFFIVHY